MTHTVSLEPTAIQDPTLLTCRNVAGWNGAEAHIHTEGTCSFTTYDIKRTKWPQFKQWVGLQCYKALSVWGHVRAQILQVIQEAMEQEEEILLIKRKRDRARVREGDTRVIRNGDKHRRLFSALRFPCCKSYWTEHEHWTAPSGNTPLIVTPCWF